MRACKVIFLIACVSLLTAERQSEENLILHAHVKSQRYCEVDNEVVALLVRFTISLSNYGDSPVLIQSASIYPRLLLSENIADLLKGEHKFELWPPDVFRQSDKASSGGRPKSIGGTQRIEPGEVFETETMEVTIPTRRNENYSGRDVALPGLYYAQLVLEPRLSGTNRFTRVISDPVEITIEKRPIVHKCQG